jgi:hypothetical protein
MIARGDAVRKETCDQMTWQDIQPFYSQLFNSDDLILAEVNQIGFVAGENKGWEAKHYLAGEGMSIGRFVSKDQAKVAIQTFVIAEIERIKERTMKQKEQATTKKENKR